jgi:adenylate cyclase
MRFRMGIDEGEVVVSEGQHLGDALNIAARIQAIAQPGGVSISGRVYRALDEPALRFRSIGRRRLKNIPEEVDVFEFADLPSDDGAHVHQSPLALESPVMAVLPIHTELVDDRVRTAAHIVRSDLLHELARVPELVVVDADSEPEDQGSSRAARYMLETGVHQIVDSVRVYATIFDVTTMNVVKSYRWTADVADVLPLSERIADEVAMGVEVELIVGEPAGLYAELDDPQAIENVYLGWYHLRTDTPEGWRRALDLFDEVARVHPDSVYGHVLAAFALWIGAANEWPRDPSAAFDEARSRAQRARELGDPTGMAQAVQAAVFMSEGRLDEALDTLSDLDIVRPTCDVTFGLEGSVRRYLGDWERAVELLDVAMRLTGIDKPWYPTVQACSLFVGGQHERAAALAGSVVEYQPNNLEALLVLAAAEVELGLQRRAHATAELIKERFPSVDVEAWLEKNPYRSREIVERWKKDLETADAMGAAG